MKPLLLLLLLGASSRASVAQEVPTLSVDDARDASREGIAFVEASADRDSVLVHEAIRLRVRFGFEAQFFERNLIQLFHRELDVPVQLQVAWLEAPASAGPGSSAGATFALNDGVSSAREQRESLGDEREYVVLEVETSLRAEAPGELVLAAPRLRFAHATRYEEDIFRGRVALDRVDAFVVGNVLTVTVHDLPEEGRPPDFTGGVGSFSVRAAVEPRELILGESISLVLTIEGDGRLGSPPRLDGIAGFRVRGMIADETGRNLTYDLTPESDRVEEVPPIGFSFFEPGSGYRTVETSPIPIVVRPRPAPPASETGGMRSLLPWVLGSLILVLLLLVLVFLAWLRMRAAGRTDPLRARIASAVAVFQEAAADREADPDDVFAAFLAAVLECTHAAVHTHDLAERLVGAGVPEDLAVRAGALHDELHAHRYGGSTDPASTEAARNLVDELRRFAQKA